MAKSGSKPAYRAQERVASQPFLRKLEGEVTKNLRKTEKDTHEPSQCTRKSVVRTLLVNLSTIRLSGSDVAPAEPPQHQKKWNKRKREKERATATVDKTVNHLRAEVHAKKADDQNAKPVP